MDLYRSYPFYYFLSIPIWEHFAKESRAHVESQGSPTKTFVLTLKRAKTISKSAKTCKNELLIIYMYCDKTYIQP